jgi:hypothetical protein
MTREEAIQEQIDEIMDDFEFDKVHQIMTALKWKLATSKNPEEVPELWEIKKNARSHLKNAVKHEGSASGGFTARFQEGVGEDTGKPFVWLTLNFGINHLNDGQEYDSE